VPISQYGALKRVKFVVNEEIAMAKNRLSIPVEPVFRERNPVTSKPERTIRVDAQTARAWRARCAAALLTCCAASGAHAGSFSGSVSGSWSKSVLSGNLEDGATGALTPTDNTTTAQCNLGCPLSLPGYPATTLAWGNGASAAPVTSTLSFVGSSFAQQPSNTVFQLGTFTYVNGASDTDSLIFGAALTLTLTDQSGVVIAMQTIPLQITTTSNDGSTAQNADFVQFPATFTTLNAHPSMNVFEGSTATFILQGKIVGDPTLELTQLLIAPGSESSGFVGNGRPVPEPGTFVLLGVGFAAAALLRRARRSSCSAAVLPVS
jgi:hypothetical protein